MNTAKLQRIEKAIVNWWGERCADFEAECPCCLAWKELDDLLADNERHKHWLREADQSWYTKLSAVDEEVARLQAELASAKADIAARDETDRQLCGYLHNIAEVLGVKQYGFGELSQLVATAKADAERYRAALLDVDCTAPSFSRDGDYSCDSEMRSIANKALNPKGSP